MNINLADNITNNLMNASDSLINELENIQLKNVKIGQNEIRNYLRERNEYIMIILHAKVAQKSYGNEKRFFCPPPCVYLLGSAWNRKKLQMLSENKSDESTQVLSYISIGSADREQPLTLDSKLFGAAKTLFISDSDKRKDFKLTVNLCYNTTNLNECSIGTFQSKSIKVISKPSKKKQSIKNSQLCIHSETRVALFNRLRSQTISTRYLFVENDTFYASSTHWGSFHIFLLHENCDESEEFQSRSGIIHYGSTIKLVCSVSGISLPRLVIRKVDKTNVIIDADDPVSQLHKCAFYLKDTNRMYLCLSQDRIIQFQATECPKEPNKETINEGACWTIITTDQAEYRWCDATPSEFNKYKEPILNVPLLATIRENKLAEHAIIELIGENFTPNLEVWFDDIKLQSEYRCSKTMIAYIPDDFCSTQPTKAEILFVRNAIIFNTGVTFDYKPVFQ